MPSIILNHVHVWKARDDSQLLCNTHIYRQYAPRSLQPLHLGGSIDGLLHGKNGHISLRMFFHLCNIIVFFLNIGKGHLLNCMIM